MAEIINQNPGHLKALEPWEVKIFKNRIHITIIPVKCREEAGKFDWISPKNCSKTVYMPEDEDEENMGIDTGSRK